MKKGATAMVQSDAISYDCGTIDANRSQQESHSLSVCFGREAVPGVDAILYLK